MSRLPEAAFLTAAWSWLPKLHALDYVAIATYFAIVFSIGFYAARKVKTERDFLLGGRRFGKGLLTMHWLCTGTHSEMAVQVCGATARVGLGGIWYQWYMMFATPFYWLIAPMTRRLRVLSTGDLFRIRYGRGLEIMYCLVALAYVALSIAMLLRGAGVAIAGATGDAVPSEAVVIVLAAAFSTYVVAGGLVAAAWTDVFQGILLVVLSVMLVPAGLAAVGGFSGLHAQLAPERFGMTAPEGAPVGDPWFVLSMSVLGLVGVVAQPHVMTATGSGKTEAEARVGMVYGNFMKRLLTVAWAVSGLIAAVAFADVLAAFPDPDSDAARAAGETLFGRSIREFLGPGWRGLMIACLVAGVTSSETFMVTGSGLVTRNLVRTWARGGTERAAVWSGRAASVVILVLGIVLAVSVESVTGLLLASIECIGLLGASVWLGVAWRRANAAGAWASFVGAAVVWAMTSLPDEPLEHAPIAAGICEGIVQLGHETGMRELGRPAQIFCMLAAEFGLMIGVSLATRPQDKSLLDSFFARLLTPVGSETEMAVEPAGEAVPDFTLVGLDGKSLDYAKASRHGCRGLAQWGLEIPRWKPSDWLGFLAAWVIVGALVGLLAWLAGVGG